MTAPSFINGEWVIPDNLTEGECPEIHLLKKFDNSASVSAAPAQVSIQVTNQHQQQESFQSKEEIHVPSQPFSYTGKPHPLAERGLEKLLRPPPDCESQLIKPKKLNLKRYSDSSFYQTSGNVYPTIDEQKQLCKVISASLFSDENRDARGRDMFQKKLSKIEDFSLESQGNNLQRDVVDEYLNGISEPQQQNFTQAPIRTFLTEQALTSNIYTSNEFSSYHEEAHATHEGITPDQAYGLIQGLKNQQNRGAEIFEQRRLNADRWITDETNVKKGPQVISPSIYQMMEDLNRPYQETYAKTLPPPPPPETKKVVQEVDMSVDINKIDDPVEILEMAMKDKVPEVIEEPIDTATAGPESDVIPEDSVIDNAQEIVEEVPVDAGPAQEVEAPEPIVPTVPEGAQETAYEPAARPESLQPSATWGSTNIKPFIGSGPTGWKSIKPPGMS